MDDDGLDERMELHAEIARITEEAGRYTAAGGTLSIPDALQDRLTESGEPGADLALIRDVRDELRGLLLLIRPQNEPRGQG